MSDLCYAVIAVILQLDCIVRVEDTLTCLIDGMLC